MKRITVKGSVSSEKGRLKRQKLDDPRPFGSVTRAALIHVYFHPFFGQGFREGRKVSTTVLPKSLSETRVKTDEYRPNVPDPNKYHVKSSHPVRWCLQTYGRTLSGPPLYSRLIRWTGSTTTVALRQELALFKDGTVTGLSPTSPPSPVDVKYVEPSNNREEDLTLTRGTRAWHKSKFFCN